MMRGESTNHPTACVAEESSGGSSPRNSTCAGVTPLQRLNSVAASSWNASALPPVPAMSFAPSPRD
eukprot:NODE_31233_length_401_cov_0.985401.p4 GENE.NODE_31233_length_401_cov_0.985401~~NODE_31233_length_401_cov_0.985401.p4  ORF type:complete len:66 (+),score=12.27 NODE_31233_length_401_cov_0.985401:111-308(+)